MRRGCISLGNIQCDECHRTILYPEHYLAVEEGKVNLRLCTNCCLSKGLARRQSKKEGGEISFVIE